MTPEELERIRAEVDRLRKLFDDAGQGEHNVLALVEHYQAEMIKAQAEAEDATAAFNIQTERIDAARAVLRQKNPTIEEVRAALFGNAP